MSTPKEPFDALLSWLNDDRDLAAQKYETIRAGMIRIFARAGISRPEDWADEAFRRAAAKPLPEPFVGDKAHYFRGFVPHLIREWRRIREVPTEQLPELPTAATNQSDEYECLVRCLQFLTPAKRDLILDYHVYAGHDKIVQHEIMASELGISPGALRGRAHNIRAELEKCVLNCTKNLRTKTKPVAADILNSGAGARSVNHGRGRTV